MVRAAIDAAATYYSVGERVPSDPPPAFPRARSPPGAHPHSPVPDAQKRTRLLQRLPPGAIVPRLARLEMPPREPPAALPVGRPATADEDGAIADADRHDRHTHTDGGVGDRGGGGEGGRGSAMPHRYWG